MPKMLQVRNFPDDLHAELVRRSREEGRTLTDFVEDILRRELRHPSRREVLERLRSRAPVDLGRPVAELLRAEREERTP